MHATSFEADMQFRPIPFVSSREPAKQKQWFDAALRESLPDKERIVRYLLRGRCLAAVPGIERDVFDNNEMIDAPDKLTDGSWIWVRTLAYWVERYDMPLPPEFLQHVRTNRYRIAKAIAARVTAPGPWHSEPTFFDP